MMRVLIILFLLNTYCTGIRAQEIVFPYEYQKGDMIRFSENGEIIGAYKTSGEFHYINSSTSKSLAKIEIGHYYQIIQFHVSFSGDYVAFLALKKSQTYILFYKYEGVNNLKFVNELEILNNELAIIAEDIVFESNRKNEIYLKFRTTRFTPNHQLYWSITKFKIWDDSYGGSNNFYEEFYIGDRDSYGGDEAEFGTLNYQWSDFLGYDLTADDKYLTAVTSVKYKNNAFSKLKEVDIVQEGNMSYGVLEWGLNKATQEYRQLFPAARYCNDKKDANNCINQFPDYDFFESGAVFGMKYHHGSGKVYGICEKSVIEPLLVDDLAELKTKNKYPLIESRINLFPYGNSANFNNWIPFSYDIKSMKFNLVGNFDTKTPFLANLPLGIDTFNVNQIQVLINSKADFIGSPVKFKFSATQPVLYIVGTLVSFGDRIAKINLITGSTEYLSINEVSYGYSITFTNDDKLIFTREISQEFHEFDFKIYDLNSLSLVKNGILNSKEQMTVPLDLLLFEYKKRKCVYIKLADKIVQFDVNSLPFMKASSSIRNFNDSLKSQLNYATLLCEKTIVNPDNVDDRYVFPIKHHMVYDDKVTGRYNISKYESSYTSTKDASPKSEETFQFNADYPAEVSFLPDSFPGSGYHNFTSEITGYEWHLKTNKLLVVTENVIDKWDIHGRKSEFSFVNHQRKINAFDVIQNDSLMISSSIDGKIAIWNIYTNKLLANLFLFDGGKNWVFILPDNYYYGSKEAVSKIAFAFKKVALPIEYFELKYNRPDLVLKALGCTNTELLKAYDKAYHKRLEKLNIKEEMLSFDVDIPYLKIVNSNLIPLEVLTDSLELNLNIYDLKYPIEKVNLYINGVHQTLTSGIFHDLNRFINKKIKFHVASGINSIEISATNTKGIESEKEKIKVNCLVKKPSDLYLVAIGANEYQQKEFNLTYPAIDAYAFANLYGQDSDQFKNKHFMMYAGIDVTKNILQQIKDSLKNAKLEDEVIIYYAGHGVLDEQFDYYLATYDIDFIKPSKNGIAYEDLEKVLESTNALKKIIMLDACHSGEIEKEEVEASVEEVQSFATNIKFRNVGTNIKEISKNELSTSKILKNVFTDLRKGTGATVISSSGGAEYAMESDEWKNGLFTYCLLHGLKDKAADANGDGEIMLSELQQYLRTEVSKLSNGAQQPTSRIENTNMDFKVW